MPLVVALLCAGTLGHRQEPDPRRPSPVPIRANVQFATISAVRELKSGQLLVTDAKRPAIYLIDPKTGSAVVVGSIGADSGQYVQPGGVYAARADTLLVLDRGQARVLVLSPAGAIVGIRSIKQRGVQRSSDADVDLQRVDSRGFAYFAQRGVGLADRLAGAASKDTAVLVRFDPLRQHADTIALLRTRKTKTVSISENMQISSAVIGSPEDTWGVASDGRVAVVRAEPYRLEWYAPNGTVTRGPIVAHEAIPFTPAEKERIEAERSANQPGVGRASGRTGGAAVGEAAPRSSGADPVHKTIFAPTKPPFEPNGEAIVSPDGIVWISRNLPAGAAKTIYDLFDGKGERIDRIELPARSRVIGFGPGSFFTAERDEHAAVSLHKYRL